MKKLIFVFTFLLSFSGVFAQLKTTTMCPAFTVDILNGKVGTLIPTATTNEIKSQFPCFTSLSSETDTTKTKCGAGVFYKDKDIYFYTARDYVEIGPNFKGKLSLPLMGAARNSLYKWLGHPLIKDVNWEAYQTQYGILILYYNKASKINKIQFSTKSTEEIKLCE